ncbi:MAG TPA: phospholipase D-like domain-containing protein [Desulfuromonadaceae bacterium]
MDRLLIALLTACAAAISLAAAGHALLHKRDSRAALGWMGLNLTLPFLGPFLYWCLGINRISRRARQWSASGRRISGTDIYPSAYGKDGPPPELPPTALHLRDLRILADKVVRSRLREGNSITPLVDGESAYPAMLEAIGHARESINLSSYIFDADGIGAEFVAGLKNAAKRGVEVRVIIDALGERYSCVPARKALAGSGVRLERFLPLRHGAYINLRNHRKLLIIDGCEAFTGGMNIRKRHQARRHAPGIAIHDLHFRVQGPVVGDLQRAFLEDWHFVTGERLDNPRFFPPVPCAGEALARCISDGPDREFRKLEQIIMGALACAGESVLIMTPYFVPDRPMAAALITTALRGVDVRIVLPESNNLPFVHWAGRALLGELLSNGVRVFYQPPPFVHTKLFLVDDIWTLIGSANLDARSLRLNFELNLSIFDSAFAARIRRHFETSLAASRELFPEELQQRSMPAKLRDNFARLFTPYL